MENPANLINMDNLASTYSYQGRWKEAEEVEIQLMETRTRILGSEHPDTLTSMANLSLVWKSQDRVPQAIGLLDEYVKLRRRILGIDHPITLCSSTALTTWQTEILNVNTSTDGDFS